MSELTYERISSHFHLPINEASKELSVCATILKKVCRSLGIKRWPHRKIRSLDNMIFQLTEKLEETNSPQETARIKSEIANFEKTKEYIIRNPNISYKSVVPKSTLQSFSKSKTKGSQNNRFVVTPNSEELVLEVLTSLATQSGSSSSSSYSPGFHGTTHSYHTLHNLNSLGCNNNNILMMNSNTSNNNDDNDVNNHDVNNNTTTDDDDDVLQSPDNHYQSAELKENIHDLSPNSPPKPPLKKLILQRKKEESTASPPPFFPDPLGHHHSHVIMMMNGQAGGDDDLLSSSPTVNNISSPSVNNTTTPLTSTTSTQQDTVPVTNNNNNIQIIPLTGNTSPQSSKKRKWDDSEYEVSLEEFRKYKSTFPDIKYQRIYEDSSLVYISKGI